MIWSSGYVQKLKNVKELLLKYIATLWSNEEGDLVKDHKRECAPIAVFAFNRPEHLHRVLIALAENDLAEQSEVTIFCDGPRTKEEKVKTDAVTAVAHSATGFSSVVVIERAHNMGCADSVIDGLTQMFRLHERLIVIEDDILASPYTLRFLNEGLIRYEDNLTVFNISAWSPPPNFLRIPSDYPYDVYAIPRFNCWGWASWRDRFEAIDWEISDYPIFKSSSETRNAFNAGGEDMSLMLDAQMEGKINSWAIRADYHRFRRGMLGINPIRSYTFNIGIGCGTHTTGYTTRFDSNISLAKQTCNFMSEVNLDARIEKKYKKIYSPNCVNWRGKIKNIFSAFKQYFGK